MRCGNVAVKPDAFIGDGPDARQWGVWESDRIGSLIQDNSIGSFCNGSLNPAWYRLPIHKLTTRILFSVCLYFIVTFRINIQCGYIPALLTTLEAFYKIISKKKIAAFFCGLYLRTLCWLYLYYQPNYILVVKWIPKNCVFVLHKWSWYIRILQFCYQHFFLVKYWFCYVRRLGRFYWRVHPLFNMFYLLRWFFIGFFPL